MAQGQGNKALSRCKQTESLALRGDLHSGVSDSVRILARVGLFQAVPVHPDPRALRLLSQFRLQVSDSKVISSFHAQECYIRAGSSFHHLEDLELSLFYSSLVTNSFGKQNKKTKNTGSFLIPFLQTEVLT